MDSLLSDLEAVVGNPHVLTDDDTKAKYLQDWRRQFRSDAMAVVRPASTREVSAVVARCHSAGVGMVPVGGNTGLVGGAVASKSQIMISLERMARVRNVDVLGATIALDAGCILGNAQRAASEHDLLLPLSLSAEESCQIGGNISTGAGGLNVVRYGTVRDQILGLEVVMPDGRIFDSMRMLRKDTAGYDLKQVFIGAEGTLGIVTGAVMRLYPAPEKNVTLWLATDGLDDVLVLFERVRNVFGNLLTAFEYLSGGTVEIIARYLEQSPPLATSDDANFVLIELAGSNAELNEAAVFDQFLDWQERGLLSDSVLATDASKRDLLWRFRHSASGAQTLAGTCIKHDIGLPVSRIGEFLRRVPAEIRREQDMFQLFVFGHIGDGNLHFTVASPQHTDRSDIELRRAAIHAAVYSLVVELGGTISAEHGVGLLKREELGQQVGEMGLSLMRQLKQQFDPLGLMNPGKML
ncbi:MAG: FAD-binding oxidoreductase [Pseudomonadota bacterium]